MPPTLTRGISLASKCLILFGCALAVILMLTLAVPWIRTSSLVRGYQREVSAQLADAWLHDGLRGIDLKDSLSLRALDDGGTVDSDNDTASLLLVGFIPWRSIVEAPANAWAEEFKTAFGGSDPASDIVTSETINGQAVSLYARSVKQSDLGPDVGQQMVRLLRGGSDTTSADPVVAVFVVRRSTNFGAGQLSTSRLLILITGLVAVVVAMFVFRVMLSRLVFKPVDRLKHVIEQVTEGLIETRSKLQTGDEFESLSTGLDEMLDQLTETQGRLQRMNESLDLKVAELAEANVGLWESTRFKTEFLANISHELRTPLNSIIGFTELLHDKATQEDEPGSKRVRFLTNILNSSQALLEMINELLDMAKIEAGRMEVNIEPTSLGDVVEGLVRIMSPQAQPRRIELVADIAEDLPLIETDPGKVQQILYNLLSNAVKFSPDDGTIRITVSQQEHVESDSDADQSDRVLISVADEGPGIPADMHDIIFEKFRQVDASHTRTHMGTGLGLAICRDLVDMLQGELWLQSSDGAGTTFFVALDVVYTSRAPQTLMGVQHNSPAE